MANQEAPLCGIFVGGQSSRMGGRAKGLLRHPATGETLVARLHEFARRLELPCVLVGQRPEYAPLELPTLADSPSGIGPLGGLSALLAEARGPALALSCDLPHLSQELIARLISVETADCDVVAPRRDGRFEPLCALYLPSVRPVLAQAIADGERSFQRLFARLRVKPFALFDGEPRQLDDWDRPEDLELHS